MKVTSRGIWNVSIENRLDLRWHWDVHPPPQESVRTKNVRTVRSSPNFLGLMGYQFSLPMVLRWHASYAEVPLYYRKDPSLEKKYHRTFVRKDKDRTVIMDILLDQSSLTTQDWAIFIYPSETQDVWLSECPKCWLCGRFYQQRFYKRLIVKSLSRAILAEKPRVVLVFSEESRQSYLVQLNTKMVRWWEIQPWSADRPQDASSTWIKGLTIRICEQERERKAN